MFLGNGIAFSNQILDDVSHVHHVVEHDRIGDEVHVFGLLVLFLRIAAFDDGATEADPV